MTRIAILETGAPPPALKAAHGDYPAMFQDLLGDGLTVVEQPVNEIGRTAMAMLLERLDEPERSQRIVGVEIPVLLVLAGEQITDGLGLLVGLRLLSAIGQLVTVDLAQHELVGIFGPLALPADVGQGGQC
mgnify:CR=1 FL=1